jgi:UDP-3-O-[3-hydroxymyristoyl] glucosamine N-acyltransferase
VTAAEIAQHLGGEVRGDGAVKLTGFAPADAARPGDLTFAENEKYFARAEQSAASAILVDGDFQRASPNGPGKVLIKVPNARIAFAKVLPLFFPQESSPAGVHSTAIVAASAQVDQTVSVGPFCVIGEQVRIGPGCVLQGGNHIGAQCHLGDNVWLFPNVTLYERTQIGNRVRIHAGTVIGADGFGYVVDKNANGEAFHRKVQQIGNVVVNDDVEIGANVTIDRGALGSTVIGKGTKIDNLVQIGHNVVVGEHCLIVSQAGIAGSTRLGNYVTLAGQAGLAGHLKIGNNVIVAAQAGVMNDIPDGQKWIGAPAQSDRQQKREWIAIRRLPELLQRVAELEKRLEELQKPGH